MRKYLFIIVILLSAVLIIVGCVWVSNPSTMKTCSCEQLPNVLTLQTEMGKSFSKDEFKNWISINYGVPSDKIHSNLAWEKDGVQYRVEMQNSILTYAWAEDVDSPVPSAGCVVACLGPPERYRAYYTLEGPPGPALQFTMLYTELGINVHASQFFDLSQKVPSPVTDEFPAMFFRVFLPSYWDDDDVYEEMLRQYKPWPGNWEDIVIDIDPSLAE